MNKLFFVLPFVLFFVISCTSFPPRGSFAAANVIAEGSDVFLFIPLKENRNLLEKILPSHKYVKKALDRTNYIYVSLFLNKRLQLKEKMEIETDERNKDSFLEEIEQSEEGKDSGGLSSEMDSLIEETYEKDKLSYDICAIGNYPKSIAGFVLKKKDGWERKIIDSGYIYYERKDDILESSSPSFSFFSIPTKDIALFSYNTTKNNKINELLEKVDMPRPHTFDIDFEMEIQQGNPSGAICVFISNPYFFLYRILGINLDLPIENVKIYLIKDSSKTKEIYNCKVILKVENLQASFATRLLLSKLLKSQVNIKENEIIVENAKVFTDRLVEIIKQVVY